MLPALKKKKKVIFLPPGKKISTVKKKKGKKRKKFMTLFWELSGQEERACDHRRGPQELKEGCLFSIGPRTPRSPASKLSVPP